LKLIANVGCMECKKVAQKLTRFDVDFEYIKPYQISDDEFIKYTEMAKEAGQQSFPILVKDDKIIDIEEVIG